MPRSKIKDQLVPLAACLPKYHWIQLLWILRLYGEMSLNDELDSTDDVALELVDALLKQLKLEEDLATFSKEYLVDKEA